MAIRRNISVLNPGIIADINIVYGSDLIPIEFYITDYVLPDNAIAILYCETSDKQLFKNVGTITNNVISFNPQNGFFTVGKNNLQIRIVADEKNLYTFEMGVDCKPKKATDDAQEVESQPTLVTQLLTEVGEVNGELANQKTDISKVNGELANQKTDIEDVQDGENIPDFVSYDDEENQETIMDVSSIKKGDKLRDILSKITKHIKNLRYVVSSFEEDFEEKCIVCLLQSLPSKDGSYYTTPYYLKKKKTVNHVEIIEVTVMGEDSSISEAAKNMFSAIIYDCFICFKLTTETTAVINALVGKNIILKVLMKNDSEMNE